MSDLNTPLSPVKGPGSNREGLSHWWHQRLTALLMLPLILLLALHLAALPQAGHAAFSAWVGSPFVSVCLLVLIGTVFYHMRLGLQVVIEDYVSTHWLRIASIIVVSFLCLFFAVVGMVSVLKIAIGI